MANFDKIEDILNNNPFERQAPSDYEQYLHAALMFCFHNLEALAINVKALSQALENHEKGHRAVNIAAMDLPPVEKDKKIS